MTDHEQLTSADVSRLTKERKYDEIEAARQDGRLALLLGTPQEEVDLIAKALTERIDLADVQALTAIGRPDLINAAREADRINYQEDDK